MGCRRPLLPNGSTEGPAGGAVCARKEYDSAGAAEALDDATGAGEKRRSSTELEKGVHDEDEKGSMGTVDVGGMVDGKVATKSLLLPVPKGSKSALPSDEEDETF